MSPLSAPPTSAPICPGDRNSDDWTIYFRKAFGVLSLATKPANLKAANSDEFATVVQVGALLFYAYTGLGGVAFSYDGAQIMIPPTTSAATVSGFVILGGN